jgi:hypothetical protein
MKIWYSLAAQLKLRPFKTTAGLKHRPFKTCNGAAKAAPFQNKGKKLRPFKTWGLSCALSKRGLKLGPFKTYFLPATWATLVFMRPAPRLIISCNSSGEDERSNAVSSVICFWKYNVASD